MASEDWRTSGFRQSMIHKIEENIQQFQMPMAKNVTEMENQVYNKAKSKEEYMNYIARLLTYIKTTRLKVQPSRTDTGRESGAPNVNTAQKGMQDPIGALQSLARQGTGNINNMGMQGSSQSQQSMGQVGSSGNVASNLLQSLNQRPGQPMNIQALHNKISGMNLMQGQQMGINQIGHQNMQANSMMVNMNQLNQASVSQQMVSQQHQQSQQQQMTGPQMGTSQIQQALQNQMSHQMGSPLNPGMQQPQPPASQQQQQQQQQQQPQQHINQLNVNQMTQQQLGHMQRKTELMNAGYPGQRNITPNQFLRQSPSPSVPSPSSLATPGSNQMVSSPALVSSPNPQHAILGGQRNMAMAPSPSSSLNTPAGMIGGATPSPLQDDQISQACKEKIQKLRKYIDPLNKMILKLTNEGYTEKMSKMKKLLEILTNPSSITKLDVLQKCEIVLEKMDFKKLEAASTGPTIPPSLKEHHFLTPLLEVVNTLLQSPTPNHTLQRTFGPSVEALFGPEIKNMPPPLKKQKTEESHSEIPDVLQGEIARLDQRFKISLDPTQPSGSKCIQLICWLDDKHLPCVPPVLVIVPADYPTVPPKCVLTNHEYATPYLSAVKKALDARLTKLPKKFSVSQLLDTWEMSVRHACNPKVQEDEKTVAATSNAPTISALQPTTDATTNSVSNGINTSLISSAAS